MLALIIKLLWLATSSIIAVPPVVKVESEATLMVTVSPLPVSSTFVVTFANVRLPLTVNVPSRFNSSAKVVVNVPRVAVPVGVPRLISAVPASRVSVRPEPVIVPPSSAIGPSAAPLLSNDTLSANTTVGALVNTIPVAAPV